MRADRRGSAPARPRRVGPGGSAQAPQRRPGLCLPAAAPRPGPGPLRRRSGSVRRRRDPEPGQGRGRADRDRLPALAGGGRRRCGAGAGRARGLGREPGERGVLSRDRRPGGGRGGLRPGRPYRAPRDRGQPGDGEPDGAARLPRRLRPRPGPLDDPLHDPVRARHPGGARRPHLQGAAASDPRRLRQHGRRVRHEGRLLPGIRAGAVGVRGHRAAGALDRRAQRGAAERRAGPRQHRRHRAGARSRWAVSRPAGALAGGDRGLLLDRPADHPADDRARLPGQHLPHPGGARRGRRGLDQHDDDRPLPRRQPARADLCDRNDHRQGGARARPAAGRAAPAQHDPGRGDPIHDGARPDL